VGDHDEGAARTLCEGTLGTLLGLRIQMTGRLVEQGERGVREIGPGQCDQLPFARGEHRGVDLGAGPAEPVDQRTEPEDVGRREQFRLGHGVLPEVGEVLGDGPGEDVRLLRNEHPPPSGRSRGHLLPAHPDRPATRLQQPRDQSGERGLPDPAGADDGQVGAGREDEIEVLDDGGGGGAVGEGDGGEGEGGGGLGGGRAGGS